MVLNPQITETNVLEKFPGYFNEMINPEANGSMEVEKTSAIFYASKHVQPFIENVVRYYFQAGGKTMSKEDFAVVEKNSAKFVADLSSTMANVENETVLATAGFLWSSVWESLKKEAYAYGDERLAELAQLSASAINNSVAAMVRASRIRR